ncbi:pancreatic lipase-related protein 2-like [Trichogramma pretiosum]|uniref:pancreatic lipase-related protein 2-like n=1 Tax=Trichogramma pretiosum TaxID=7493 RepID=UPI0006C9E447|nr:pancreatic lipase-related protein 2-like [Trichogramma pretiosum]
MKKSHVILRTALVIAALAVTLRIVGGVFLHLIRRNLACWPQQTLTQQQQQLEHQHDEFQIDFHLYRRGNPIGHELLNSSEVFDATRHFRSFDPSKRTFLLSHGFRGPIYGNPMQKLTESLLRWQDANVILVDWQRGCKNTFQYERAVANTQHTAKQIRLLVSNLKRSRVGGQWGYVHFIGHSLGAHVVSHAAKLLKINDQVLVDRVTGLDPAEPCFEIDEASPLRLSRDSARFVDVLHSAVAHRKHDAFGLLDPLGDADFYINGGTHQPGCQVALANLMSSVAKPVLSIFKSVVPSCASDYCKLTRFVMSGGVCDHFYSVYVFIDSVDNEMKNKHSYLAQPWNLTFDTNEQPVVGQLSSCSADQQCPEMGINAEKYQYSNNRHNVYYVKSDYTVHLSMKDSLMFSMF